MGFFYDEWVVNFVLGIYEFEVRNSIVGYLRGVGEVVELVGNDIIKIWRFEVFVDRELFEYR